MAKLVGPFMSLEARGKLGDALVAFGWKGRNVLRAWTVPSNPRSINQKIIRQKFEAMGKNIIHVGSNGMGQTVKLMNQILVAGTLNAVVEALIFAQNSGVALEKAIDAVKGGAAGSWQLSNLAPRIIKRDFQPGFMVDLIQKDLRLVMNATEAVKTPLPVTSFIHQIYYSIQSAGEGKNGTQALVKAMERLTGVKVGQVK